MDAFAQQTTDRPRCPGERAGAPPGYGPRSPHPYQDTEGLAEVSEADLQILPTESSERTAKHRGCYVSLMYTAHDSAANRRVGVASYNEMLTAFATLPSVGTIERLTPSVVGSRVLSRLFHQRIRSKRRVSETFPTVSHFEFTLGANPASSTKLSPSSISPCTSYPSGPHRRLKIHALFLAE
jgi:hypothetical protein